MIDWETIEFYINLRLFKGISNTGKTLTLRYVYYLFSFDKNKFLFLTSYREEDRIKEDTLKNGLY